MAERTAKERTGRRAWRQWSKRREYKGRREARKNGVKYQPLMTWNEWRKANNEGVKPTEKPARTISACELPGMTMGARKRAWREYDRQQIEEATDDDDAGKLAAARRSAEHLLRLRIGKRLRPCPGCEECRGYDDGIGVIHCDGSGVLPAKSQRRQANG